MAELKHADITQKIIGCAFEVHNFLGSGFQEVIYQRALALELNAAGLNFAREVEQPIFYKDYQDEIGTRRSDFIVEGKVLVELKAITELEKTQLSQILNYLKAYKFEVGLLINFGGNSVEFKRVVLNEDHPSNRSRFTRNNGLRGVLGMFSGFSIF
jgi:GxxExxY protein